MDIKSIIPFQGKRVAARQREDAHPLPALRREIDDVFDDFFRSFGFPMLGGEMPAAKLVPRLDVSETEQEIQIQAELPGIDEKDVEVTLADDVLTIRGEKKAEQEKKERDYHLMERSQGTFVRSLRLPFTVDAGQVTAAFKNGVLTITIPKPKEVQQKTHKIAVTGDSGTAAAQSPEQKPSQPQAAAAE
jgi:HSP20 family protein